MTRRSAVATLLRVAELQEAAARGRAGQALTQAREAQDAHQAAHDDLRRAGLAGGSREALESTTQVRLWRAEAVELAGQQVEVADGVRQEALATWTESRRRQRLFETMAARKREEARAARERADQSLADELSGLRGQRP